MSDKQPANTDIPRAKMPIGGPDGMEADGIVAPDRVIQPQRQPRPVPDLVAA